MSTKRRPGGRRPSTGRSETGTTALLVRFERWYGQHVISAGGHEHTSAAEARELLGLLFARSGQGLHEPLVAVLEPLIDSVEADPALAPRLPEVIETLEHYLDFAVETGAWQGSDAQIDASSEFLEVVYDLSTNLLANLLDALDAVEDVPDDVMRRALSALPGRPASVSELQAHLVTDLRNSDPAQDIEQLAQSEALAIERVLALLCVAVEPQLLPSSSVEQVIELIDIAAGASAEQSTAADPATERILTSLRDSGVIRLTGTTEMGRYEAPAGLRAVLADTVVDIADELGLLADGGENPHAPGTSLVVKAAVIGSKPAEWRRLQLEAVADLGELHLALQLALDWANDQPHGFRLSDVPDEIFTPDDRIADEPDDPRLLEENDIEIGEMLVDVGDELLYDYGFDTPREVVIRLERVEEERAEVVLPRCVGVSGGADVDEVDALLTPLRLR